MSDSEWSSSKVMAWAVWALSGAFVVACAVASGDPHTTTMGMCLCTVAIILAAAASTIHVRSFFCAQKDRIKWAFELGHDKGRLEALEERMPLQRVQ